ncbi:MAG: AMP-binding protein [Acetobacteraceae bacterium]|nr:AMP-binding protein [Acetobacteraceae bacterium]
MSFNTLSYVHGAATQPLFGWTIGQCLDHAIERFGERPALVVRSQAIRWSYAKLGERVDALAAGLVACGLQPGDRIGIWSLNRSEWVLAQFATAKAGLILVNINPAYRAAELEYALNKSGCRALITATAFKSSDYLGLLETVAPELRRSAPGALQAARLPALRSVILLPPVDPTLGVENADARGTLAFDAVCAMGGAAERARLDELAATLQFDDGINIQFTSGTTGAPKGATLTHHNIVNNGYFIGEAMRLSEQDRLCIPVPLYHCFGMVLGNMACVTHGAAMIFPGEGFDPLLTLQTVAEERCTGLHGVPTMFIAELEHPEFRSFDLSSLRTGIMAGSPCPIEVMRRVMESMHLRDITIAYGMTETSPVSFQTTPDDPVERRVSTVGRIHPHLEVKLVDGAGHIVTRGTPGELCTRGYSVMLGYWDDKERTAEVIDSARWMHTGDLATIDEEGYCAIVGRLKDMVIRGGENIYPREVEEFLYTHPAIQDVQVFGVPDRRMGEALCAWVRLRPGEALTETELAAFCRGRIAHYKIPSHIRFVDAFPMTVTGKVQKYRMRQAMALELG